LPWLQSEYSFSWQSQLVHVISSQCSFAMRCGKPSPMLTWKDIVVISLPFPKQWCKQWRT
jgi:hypothetical protein